MIGGDIITAYNGDAVESVQDLRSKILRASPGDEIRLTILRDGYERNQRHARGTAGSVALHSPFLRTSRIPPGMFYLTFYNSGQTAVRGN